MAGFALTRASRKVLAELEKDPEWFPTVLTRIACGDGLTEIAKDMVVVAGAVLAWIRDEDHPERQRAYEHALKVAAELRVHEVLPIADNQEGNVRRDALKINSRFRVAQFWDRERYGDREDQKQAVGVTVVIQKFGEERVAVSVGTPPRPSIDVTPLDVPDSVPLENDKT